MGIAGCTDGDDQAQLAACVVRSEFSMCLGGFDAWLPNADLAYVAFAALVGLRAVGAGMAALRLDGGLHAFLAGKEPPIAGHRSEPVAAVS